MFVGVVAGTGDTCTSRSVSLGAYLAPRQVPRCLSTSQVLRDAFVDVYLGRPLHVHYPIPGMCGIVDDNVLQGFFCHQMY